LETANRIFNIGGGAANACSLAALSRWCADRFGPHKVASSDAPRRFDIPWMVMDSSAAAEAWGWRPEISLEQMLEEIAFHAEMNPEWLTPTS
jgi:CDP-paratose 2-epimerase